MTRCSVIIITKDEERNIRDCLESVKWADEIVVVDSGSIDNTLQICQEYTDKIFTREFTNWAVEKNFGIQNASGDWIFSIDADERCTEKLQKEIKHTLQNPTPYDCFFIPRKFYFYNHFMRYGGCYPNYQLRLFKRGKAKFKEYQRIHEGTEIYGKVGYLQNALLHFSYHNLADYFKRFNRYSSLAAEELLDKGIRVKFYHFLLPPLGFIFRFILRAGFLDGFLGFLWAALQSFYAFTKYAKLWELQR